MAFDYRIRRALERGSPHSHATVPIYHHAVLVSASHGRARQGGIPRRECLQPAMAPPRAIPDTLDRHADCAPALQEATHRRRPNDISDYREAILRYQPAQVRRNVSAPRGYRNRARPARADDDDVDDVVPIACAVEHSAGTDAFPSAWATELGAASVDSTSASAEPCRRSIVLSRSTTRGDAASTCSAVGTVLSRVASRDCRHPTRRRVSRLGWPNI